MNVLIVGRGRVGSAIHRCLKTSERHRVSLVGRRVAASKIRAADAIILTVPDEAIRAVAAEIAPNVRGSACVLHCAGARGIDELEACRARGVAVGVMHPMISFPSKRTHPPLAGATFTVHGSRRAVGASRLIVAACGARAVSAEATNPAYHAAAALAANGAAALAFVSVRALVRLGFKPREAERAIGGLLCSVGNNVRDLGVPRALTGPIARGDADTVAAHRDALRRLERGAQEAYDAVLPIIVRCARASGLPRHRAERILRLVRR